MIHRFYLVSRSRFSGQNRFGQNFRYKPLHIILYNQMFYKTIQDLYISMLIAVVAELNKVVVILELIQSFLYTFFTIHSCILKITKSLEKGEALI